MVIKSRNTSGILVEVEEYQFVNLGHNKDNFLEPQVSQYSFNEINQDHLISSEEHQKEIRVERHYAKESSFVIDPRVHFHRGLKRQQEEEINHQIKAEVREKVKRLEKKAYIKGADEGKKIAYQESQNLLREEIQNKLNIFQEMIDGVVSKKEEILKTQIQELYQMLKILVKWIILRELREDGEYINRLLEKLILELGNQENLLIKVNEEKFLEMPVILELLQKKLGEFKNVRIERSNNQDGPGLIVESMNTILDGSFESQMKNLDKLFLNVESHE